MPTANFYIGPSDGWVLVASAGATFTRVSGYPHTHPYFVYAGSTAPSLLATAATGSVIFSTGVPTAGQAVVIGSETYTFRASATLPFEVTIGASNTATATNFAAVVNSTSTLVNASISTGTVTLTAKAVGTQGNYALSENATNVTVSGALMTGGVEAVIGTLVCHKPYWNNTATPLNLYVRVPNPVPNSTGRDGKLRLDVITTDNTSVAPFTNAAAGTSSSFTLSGGLYQLAASATWGSLVMNQLGPDGTTWLSVSATMTSNGGQTLYLPPGTYQVVTTGGSAYYVSVTRIPGG